MEAEQTRKLNLYHNSSRESFQGNCGVRKIKIGANPNIQRHPPVLHTLVCDVVLREMQVTAQEDGETVSDILGIDISRNHVYQILLPYSH